MLPTPIQEQLTLWFLSEHHREVKAISATPVGGGSINNTYKVTIDKEPFFLKLNNAKAYPGMFAAEAKGLQLLAGKSPLVIPKPLHWGDAGNNSFLLMEWVEQGRGGEKVAFGFGRALAALHANSADSFGLDEDNYIGSLPQSNRQHSSWIDFFVAERIEPQLRMAIDKGELSTAIIKHFESLYGQLSSIFPPCKPSLLHGDLWSGNYFYANGGATSIFDPAAYYGHPEVDLAMTKLFGGFTDMFYEGYQNASPLAHGFLQRVEVYNLYYLLVHVNLFGGGYAHDVKQIIGRF